MDRDQTNKSFWEKAAFLYTPFIEKKKSSYKALCKSIAPYLTKDMKVLELACGTGQLTVPLADKAGFWVATDFSENMIQAAKRRPHPENISFSVEDATALAYDGESFDAVVIANALHIMPNPELALLEINRVLKPQGFLFAPTFVYEGKPPKLKMWILKKIGFETFHKWGSADLARFVSDRGFDVIGQGIYHGSLLPECNLIARKR